MLNLPHFHHSWFLLLLFLIPFLIWNYLKKNNKRQSSIRFPSVKVLKRLPSTWALKVRHSIFGIRLLLLSILIFALARPQQGEEIEDITTQGVDIILAFDASESMRTLDFKPKNRLEAAKSVMEDFVKGRKHDRMGLVLFGVKAYTQCPLTLDYGVLIQFIRKIYPGMIDGNGTAIGTGLLTAANRLRKSEAKSKVIILTTDGVNNQGEVDPLTAAQAAKALGIKIYTIGVGKEGEQPLEIDDPIFGKRIVAVPTEIDETTLREIAKLTNGKYFRAQDTEGLRKIYAEIDRLEKTEITASNYTRWKELYWIFVMVAFILLFIEIILANTRFVKLP